MSNSIETFIPSRCSKSYSARVLSRQEVEMKKDTKQPSVKMVYLMINNVRYDININDVLEKEPATILGNIHDREFKTSYDKSTGILEYLEPIPNFNYILDYVRGYDSLCLNMTFFGKETTDLREFKYMLVRLQLNNFLDKIHQMYPLIKINEYEKIFTDRMVNILEPMAKLFNFSRKLYPDVYVFCHTRDDKLFHEWFETYLENKITANNLADKIIQLLDKEPYNKYKYLKITEDINYYGFTRLNKILLKKMALRNTQTLRQHDS